MATGEFEYCGEDHGQPVYRVRWNSADGSSIRLVDNGQLTDQEMKRARFIRHLVETGRISEDNQ